jgi:hypothetical protein
LPEEWSIVDKFSNAHVAIAAAFDWYVGDLVLSPRAD